MGCLSVIPFHAHKGMCLLQRKEHIHRLKAISRWKKKQQQQQQQQKKTINDK